MDIKPIKTKADYKAMLAEIEGLMMARANTPEGERLDVLVTLVEAYERKHFYDGGTRPCRGDQIAHGGSGLEAQ